MDVLAEKIASILDITVQQAIEIYPIIRNQFVYYHVLASINEILIIAGFCMVVVSMFSVAWDFDNNLQISKRTKNIIVLNILCFVIGAIAWIIVPILAPDIALIMRIVGG